MAFVIQKEMFKHRISQFNHVSGSFRYPGFTDEKAAFSGIIAVHAINALFSTVHSPDSPVAQSSGLLGVLHGFLPSYV